MRDFNPNPTAIKKVHTCSYCGPGITHIIDPSIYPNDKYAQQDKDKDKDKTGKGKGKSKWKCGNCQDRELQDRIVRVTPNSQRAKEIIEERKKEEKKYKQLKIFEAMIRNMPGKLVR